MFETALTLAPLVDARSFSRNFPCVFSGLFCDGNDQCLFTCQIVVCVFPIDDRPGTFHGVFLGTALVALCQAGNGERAENQQSWTTVGTGSGGTGGGNIVGDVGFRRARSTARVRVMANRMTVRMASIMIRWFAWARLVLRASTCSGYG